MSPLPLPTEAELAILTVLWNDGPSTVRAVHERIGDSRDVGYTTVLKLLQIMTEKGLVVRDASARSHEFRAAVPRERTQRALTEDLLERAFGGSAAALVHRALSTKRATAAELREIRRLLDEHGGGG